MDASTTRVVAQIVALVLMGLCIWLWVDLVYRHKAAQLWAQYEAQRIDAAQAQKRELYRAWDESAQLRRELTQAQTAARVAQFDVIMLRIEMARAAWKGADGAEQAQTAQDGVAQ